MEIMVYIADDLDFARQRAKRCALQAIRQMGHELMWSEFRCVEEALAALVHEQSPDLVITDYYFAGSITSGLDVARYCAEQRIPCIIFSSEYIAAETHQVALQHCGALLYFCFKPNDDEWLQEAIINILQPRKNP